jgi:8-oxo-dGTP diphosphatase
MAEYRNPKPTVDVIIELHGRPDALVLIERAHAPRGWALPGGFVDEGEWVADAAVREAKEETGLDVELVELFHVYSDPARDPRQHTVSTVFIGRARGEPVGSDDAASARVVAFDALPSPLCFDHGVIVADYLRYRRTGQRPPARR